MRLWLDDIRNPANHVGEGWTWVTTAVEAIEILASRDVLALSLDYDLLPASYGCTPCRGGVACPDHASGHDVVEWLARHPERAPADVRVHSANPLGSGRMLARLRAIGLAPVRQVLR
jgi:hypothetical protein